MTVLVMFLIWEGIELQAASSDELAHLFHYSRGISTSLLTAGIVVWVSRRQHTRRSAALEQEVTRRTAESQEARRFLQLVVDATPASLVVLDRDNRIVQANRTAELVHGPGLRGAHCMDALAGDGCRCDECPAQESRDKGIASRLPGLLHASATGEVLEVETHPLQLNGQDGHVLLVEQVVTERKKLEARILHQEKMAAFGLFAAEVAHDLGNPLSSIDAQLQILDVESLPEDAAQSIALVHDEVRRLHRILRELVSFARKRRDEPDLVSVTGVVDDTLRLLRHDRRMRNIEVRRDYDADAPLVYLVEDHLMQVVMNLLINAIDAVPPDGSVSIEVRETGGGVALRVHDTGTGMDEATLRRCLEPLFTTKEEGKGTGLGLSIARDIIEAGGGEIDVHSALGRGTTVIVTLPAAGDSDVPQARGGGEVLHAAEATPAVESELRS